MSTLKTNNVQVGQSVTATNNFTLYQPSSPDGTVRLGVGNSGATSADAVIVDNAGLFKFNSGYGSAATAYGCRAWVNFNGTGTVAIRASGNVSSITDNGVGDYTVNFTNAMPDANYSASMNILEAAARIFWAQTLATGSIRVICANLSQTPSDNAAIGVSIFR
jgi:hypothetical protein